MAVEFGYISNELICTLQPEPTSIDTELSTNIALQTASALQFFQPAKGEEMAHSRERSIHQLNVG